MGRNYYDGHRDCPSSTVEWGWHGSRHGVTVPLYVRVYTGPREHIALPGETTKKRAWTRVGTLCVNCGAVSGDAEDRVKDGRGDVVIPAMATRAGGLPTSDRDAADQAGPS
jgi:hypothetical protein